ncbi:HD domain-containing protein [Natrinema longum]|uniref:HD domain-containing protein n=1 Tax=Natrinema longum TaxID=370324 RepID=A0A8A2U932_9EURY|nr:HD domain-containing protein [Natrinema longum]MBZ6493353.1 HD domain-containing protein [Natrinema longum]QSW85299.1 HD domain-containing protein [Natrinema longum]
MTQELGPLARELSFPYYEDALPAHDRFHAKRVRDVSIRLANECEGTVDRDVLSAAAWLHDIGRPRERRGEIEDHGEWAAAEASARLAAESVPSDRIEAIGHCLRSHSIRTSSPEPATLEAKLLFDADKLDAVGARGLVRLACIVGERSGRTGGKYAVIDDTSALEMEPSDGPDVSLLREWAKERLDALYTPPGRQLGTARWDFMEEFFVQFSAELGVEGNA